MRALAFFALLLAWAAPAAARPCEVASHWHNLEVKQTARGKITTFAHNHVGPLELAGSDGTLQLHVTGPKPTWRVVRLDAGEVDVEINGGSGIPAFVQGAARDVTLAAGPYRRVVLAPLRKGVVRLTVIGRDSLQLAPRLVPLGTTGKGWLLVVEREPDRLAARPAEIQMAPAEPRVAPASVPASASPQQAEAPEETYPNRFLLGTSWVGLNETIPDAEVADPVIAPQPGELPIQVRSLHLRQRVAPHWAAELDARWWERYTVVDEMDPTNRHARDEGWIKLGVSRSLQLYGMSERLYGGLQVRGVTVENSRKALFREYLFANSQWYVGPVAGAAVTVPLWGPLSGVAAVSLQPVLSLLGDQIALETGVNPDNAGRLDQLPLMLGATGEAGLEAALDRWVGRLTYRYETLRPLTTDFQTLLSVGLSLGYRY